MFEKNLVSILQRINSNSVVLDIGGWAAPFNRANYVVDIMPYETRGFYGSFGGSKEFFTKDTWIQQDVSGTPLPFKDKEIDYVVCSQILEDIRDPIYLCKEIVRVGKQGYVEVPSRTIETVKMRKYTGFYHHRWLVELNGSEFVFRAKTHLLEDSWKFHFPKRYMSKIRDIDRVTFLFWEGNFGFKEVIQISELKVASELERFVRSKHVYPKWFYVLDKIGRMPKNIAKKIMKRNSGYDAFWNAVPEFDTK